jgi:hypothetical protein
MEDLWFSDVRRLFSEVRTRITAEIKRCTHFFAESYIENNFFRESYCSIFITGMRYVFVIILVPLFVLQNVSKLVIVINYAINKEYIAKNLCINRDKPESCCEGKCELKKNLDEAEKKENGPINLPKDKTEVLFFSDLDNSVFELFPILLTVNDNFQSGNLKAVSFSVFHPPPVAVLTS